MKLLIGVVVYNRMHTIGKWLKAWPKVTKPCPTKLAIFNNYDGEAPPTDQKELILKGNPDYYIPRPNIGCDVGAFQDAVNGKYVNDYDWDVLGWFVDDFIPMKKDFLEDFLTRIQPINVGLVGACYEPANHSNLWSHYRTVGFMAKREVLSRLEFPADPMKNRFDAFEMEHGPNNMTTQIEKLGYDTVPAIGKKYPEPGYSHWPNNSEWMWDCEMLHHLNLTKEFEREFE